MAYTKHTWQCGESISADLLNHMEDGIAEASGGGSCDCGYECEESWQEIWSYDFNSLSHHTQYGDDYYYEYGANPKLLPTTIKVEINSEEYILEGTAYSTYNMYWGAPLVSDGYGGKKPDFSGEYQFSIAFKAGEGMPEIELYVPTDGDYDVTISEYAPYITTTDCFKRAVNSVTSGTFIVTYNPNEMSAFDKTFAEITEAIDAGQTVVLRVGNDNDGWGMFALSYYSESQIVFTYNEVYVNSSLLYHEEYVLDWNDIKNNDSAQYSLTPSV